MLARQGFTLALPLLLLFAVGIVPGRASAQSFMSPAEVQDCVCRARALQTLRQENDGLQSKASELRSQLQDLEARIDSTRKTMDPNDADAVRNLADMIGQRDALKTQYQSTAFPAAWTATSKLNAAVGEYNQRCTQRQMRNIDVESANANPTCPPAP
ncbi:MAG TPA: hypothetical protein VHA10_14035 [Hypericibacter adhaerens]|jgi:hypothetical protein|uniref:Uncharacterized protein n=1 Tax=Hypericibacter adhaerens TaxID=2602016 RepID=A0A5J6N088_9PROT|nr:hypothetical protein [Hypericibacter adhaerens]QEX22533.1 hypothetical protein FRZ61_24650 [Hypericibacter adhaerens]HWA44328.1 hypothetical protein [Hypericibacter adhaerens]